MTSTSNTRIDLRFAKNLANEAAHLAMQHFGHAIARRKQDGTLVTNADEAIDRHISQRIADRFPEDAVLSEEQVTVYDPAVPRTWVIDPLDGTTNFARGFPTWGISIALLVDGAPRVGVLHFPALGERFVAVAGSGAMRNQQRIHTVPAATPIADDLIFMECTRTRRLYDLSLPFKRRILGSAAYHLCKVAQGCAVGGIEGTPKLWDIAAAGLILQEAGGVLHPLTESVDSIFPLPESRADYGAHNFTLLHAANAELAQRMLPGIRTKSGVLPSPLPVASDQP